MVAIEKFFKNKKILITGHTGFKGSWLTRIFLNWGTEIIGIALRPNTTPNLFSLLGIKKSIRNYFVDIRNFKEVKEIFLKEKPEIIFHLAAQSLVRDSYDEPLYTFETNILGTANVLEAIRRTHTVRSGILITTDKVYEEKRGNFYYKETDKLGGYDPYSSSKAGAEIVIDSYIKSFFNPKDYNKKHKTLIVSARSGNVIGGGDWQKDRLIPDIIRAIFEGKEKVIIRNPNSIRPWQYVLEPLYGYLLLAKKLYEGKKEFSGPWNFAPEKESCIKVEEIVEMALKILKKESYIIKKDHKKYESKVLKLDNSKAKKMLGWKPLFDIKKILELTMNWYKSFYEGKDVLKLTNQEIKNFFNKILT